MRTPYNTIGCEDRLIAHFFYIGTRDQTSEGFFWLGRSPFFIVGNTMGNK